MNRITMSTPFTALAALGILLFALGQPAGAQDGTALTGTAVVEPHVARAELLPTPPAAPEEALSAPNDFIVQRNTSLGYAGTHNWTSSTNEPSLAESNSDVVFFSGNWYASLSLDGGQTFSFINPFTLFPASYGGFCCDQVVQYDRSHDLFIWLLQYVKDSNANIQRIAVATSADLRNGSGWTYWDITPQLLGWPSLREWDFPDMSVGSTYLYVTSNVFATSGGSSLGSTVWRMSLAQLAA